MQKFMDMLGLKREAILFDARLYIIKSIMAVATGYIVGKSVPIARIDMISVLLGVMYTLEPINLLGIKGGLQQLLASVLGAVCTSILIIFFGINVFTIGISMALTLYVSVRINWRMVSPVAIFTCIYMTQFVQRDISGSPSIWLTFRLRIIALGLGVLIAIFFNYLFSFFYYRKIAYKRLQFAKMQLIKGLKYTEGQLTNTSESKGREYITLFPAIFNDLDLVYSNIDTMLSESKYSINLLSPDKLRSIEKILKYFRDINHLAYDINFEITRNSEYSEPGKDTEDKIKQSINILDSIDFAYSKCKYVDIAQIIYTDSIEYSNRIQSNVNMINRYVSLVVEETRDALCIKS